jgi:hypothetical protein
MTTRGVSAALRALGAPLRLRALAGVVMTTLATLLVALAAGVWLVRLGLVDSPAWVLVTWAGALGAAGAMLVVGWRRVAAVGAMPLATYLEQTGRFRAGALRAQLEPPAAGSSESLRRLADERLGDAIRSRGKESVGGLRAALGRLVARASLATAAAVLLVALAGPVRGTAAALWNPALAWELLSAGVGLEASAGLVERGGSVGLTARAPGRREGTLWLRAPGEPWTARRIALDAAGVADTAVGPLEGDLFARFEAGGRSSDTLHIRVRVPVLIVALEVIAEYPAYLGRDPEALPLGGDTLLLPAGTRVVTTGRASGGLGSAAWHGAGGDIALAVAAESFSGSFTPAGDGAWELRATDGGGSAVGGVGARLVLQLVPDRPPVAEVVAPGADTLRAAGGMVPVVADVRDDHELVRVALETRGPDGLARLRDLDTGGASDRALVTTVLDLEGHGMTPGDTLRYRVLAWDNSPARQAGQSRTLVVVIPTRSELRHAQRDGTDALGRQLDSLAQASRDLQRQTEDLSRRQPRGEEAGQGRAGNLSFEESRRAEAVTQTQEKLLEELRRLDEELREMARSAQLAGIADSAFLRRLAELRDELRRAMSPELRERLAELQEALRDLDAPRAREGMRELAEVQQQMREALERARELFERAALERELGALGQEAAELAEAQRQWAESVMQADSSRAAAEERALAARADSLAAGLERAAERLDSPQARPEMVRVAEKVRDAAEGMREAAGSAAQGQRQRAQQQGRQAQQQLSGASQQVQEQRQQQQEEWREEVIRALDQALLETTRLTQRQLAVAEGFRRGRSAAELRAEQALMEEGVRQLIEQVMAAGARNALVSPRIAGTMAAARLEMGRARGAISSATLNLREGAERAGEAVDALNVAAFMLVRARADVAGSSSGTAMAEAMERMAQLARQQGGIGEDASGLLSMLDMPGWDQQLMELAGRQREMARELDRLRAETDAGAAEQFAAEARELARLLEAGRLDPETVARQERLFRRMLDAGRTLQGEEEDEERERRGRTAEGGDPLLPASLHDRLREADGRVRLPTWEELQRFSPQERRLVADYFRRLGGGGAR